MRLDVPEGQPLAPHLLEDIAAAMQDPDHLIAQALIDKVSLGYDFPLSFSSAVWSGRNGPKDFDEPMLDSGNYRSCKDRLEQVRKQFQDDCHCGRMLGPMSRQEGETRWPNRFKLGPLGAQDKKDGSCRVLHDGSRPGVNEAIDKNMDFKVRRPGVADVRAAIGKPRRWWVFKLDVKAAHRIPRVRDCDQGLMACELDPGECYVNTVGTFGFTSAGIWWDTLAALQNRSLVRLFGKDFMYSFVYILLAVSKSMHGVYLAACLIMCFFTVVGVPLHNLKLILGPAAPWIGFDMRPFAGDIGLVEEKRLQALAGVRSILYPKVAFGVKLVSEVRGLLAWIAGVFEQLKPFLQTAFILDRGLPRKTTWKQCPRDLASDLLVWEAALSVKEYRMFQLALVSLATLVQQPKEKNAAGHPGSALARGSANLAHAHAMRWSGSLKRSHRKSSHGSQLSRRATV